MATLIFTPNSDPAVYLSEADPVLGQVIAAVGLLEVNLRPDRFTALARAIVGQQLSVSAASTIWRRLADLAGTMDAETVAGLDEAMMRSAGLSRAKSAYVRDLAMKVRDGTVDLDRFETMSDEDVVEDLTRVKGIGRWTAEMFLIFSLGRLDVIAVDDVGLQRAVSAAYGSSQTKTEILVTASSLWRPYRTVASLYLWEALDGGLLAP